MIADEGLDTLARGGEDRSTSRLVWPPIGSCWPSHAPGVLGLSAVPLGMIAALAGVSIADIGVNEFVEAGIGLAA